MDKTIRPAPFFIADDRALDFLNSLARPWGDEIEWLSCGHDLLDWLDQAGMVPSTVLKQFRNKVYVKECDAIAVQARELREWFRSFVISHAGKPLSSSIFTELDGLNHLLAQDNTYSQIQAENLYDQEIGKDEKQLHWKLQRRWNSPAALLQPLAQAIAKLICQNNFESVKDCKGPKCILWFLDISQNHTRQWCSMAVCGNRAKAAAFRERKKNKAA